MFSDTRNTDILTGADTFQREEREKPFPSHLWANPPDFRKIFGIRLHIFKGLFFLGQATKGPPSHFTDILIQNYIYFALRIILNK